MCEHCNPIVIENPRDMHGAIVKIHGHEIGPGDVFYADYYKVRLKARFISKCHNGIYVDANDDSDKIQLQDRSKSGTYIPLALCRPISKKTNRAVMPKCTIYPASKREEIQHDQAVNYHKNKSMEEKKKKELETKKFLKRMKEITCVEQCKTLSEFWHFTQLIHRQKPRRVSLQEMYKYGELMAKKAT